MKLNISHLPAFHSVMAIQELLYGTSCLEKNEIQAVLDWCKTATVYNTESKELLTAIVKYFKHCKEKQ